MKEIMISTRNAVLQGVYKRLLKPWLFSIDPERVHDHAMTTGVLFGRYRITRGVTSALCMYKNKRLGQTIAGIHFPNPVGLAAGFDKNAQLTNILPNVGFGFIEVGSITGEPCKGNPKPRIWRLPKSNALVVYYGLKNDGCEVIAQRLYNKTCSVPLGISVAKTNCPETVNTEVGIKDYVKAYNMFRNIGDYDVLNISCPNAFGGEPFTDAKKLARLLKQIKRTKKPLFVKIPPDLEKKELDKILLLVKKFNITGVICANLTKKRKKLNVVEKVIPEKGGISGKPVEQLTNESIRYMYKKTKGDIVIIGCGGVFSAEDAYKKIKLGASLVQLITGMIYQGPQSISTINQGLVRLLKKDGFVTIAGAVGVENK